jgi:hypothetical protein
MSRSLPQRLRSLSLDMEQIGDELVRMGGEPAGHGAELIEAAGMCRVWSDGIEGNGGDGC